MTWKHFSWVYYAHAKHLKTRFHISGVSGVDNLGHGHYFANNNQKNPAQPSLPVTNPHQQAPPRPIQSGGQQYHNDPSSNHLHSQQSYGSDSPEGNSGNGATNNQKNSYAGNWNYLSSNDRNNNNQPNYGQNQDKDSQQG